MRSRQDDFWSHTPLPSQQQQRSSNRRPPLAARLAQMDAAQWPATSPEPTLAPAPASASTRASQNAARASGSAATAGGVRVLRAPAFGVHQFGARSEPGGSTRATFRQLDTSSELPPLHSAARVEQAAAPMPSIREQAARRRRREAAEAHAHTHAHTRGASASAHKRAQRSAGGETPEVTPAASVRVRGEAFVVDEHATDSPYKRAAQFQFAPGRTPPPALARRHHSANSSKRRRREVVEAESDDGE